MHRLADIHETFFSEETGKPFESCSDCGCPLNQPDQNFIIQKAMARGEVIMEIAMCESCHGNLQESYSKETMEAIWNFYLDHVDFEGRLQDFSTTSEDSPDPWLESCVTCRATRDSSDEFVLIAQCHEGDMVFGEFPWMVCGKCIEKMMDLMSEKSRGEYDRWVERCVPMAPADVDDPSRFRVFV